MRLRYTPLALAELEAILERIGQRSPQGATRVRARIHKLALFIQERPHGGQRTSEKGLRRVVATPYPYLMFYEVMADEVVIVSVRHGARAPRTMPGNA